MRAKQVTALMMAATLAVTSNGVTALAAETGDSSAAVAEVTDEVVSPELEEVVKGAQTSDDAITVTATTSKTEVTYGDTVEVTTAVDTGKSDNNGKLTVNEYVLYEGDDVLQSNTTGTFTFAPRSGKTYKVRVIFNVSGQTAKVYAEGDVDTITVNKITIDASELHVPTVGTITNKKAAAPTVDAEEIKAAVEAANTADEAYGTWTCSAATLKTGVNKNALTFTFTAGDNYQVLDSSVANATASGTYTATADVTVVQLATGVTVKDSTTGTASVISDDTLTLGTSEKAILTAEVATASGDNKVSNSKVVWTSSDESKVKVTTDDKDNAAVVTAVAATGTEGVKIIATAADGATDDNGEAVKAVITVKVQQGVSADDIYFDTKLPEITYNGTGDLNDYYEEYIKELNAKTTLGTYSLADGTNAKADAQVSTLKTTTKDSETTEKAIKVVFTLKNDKNTLKAVDGTKTSWDSGAETITKEYDVTVNKQTITSDASAVTGTLKDSYVAGTTLEDILKKAADDTNFAIQWQVKDATKGWTDVADASS